MSHPDRASAPVISAPPVAPPLRDGLASLAAAVPTDVSNAAEVAVYRAVAQSRGTAADALAERFALRVTEPGEGITSFRADRTPALRVVFLHGGGLIAGNRFDGADVLLRHAEELALDVWTVEYPLAPDAHLDVMIGRAVTAVRLASADGIPVVLAGQSAGGGLAAATALACRDAGIALRGAMLVCPMLDAAETASARQYPSDPSWSAVSNATAWATALDGARTTPPGQRTDLAGLPPVYLDAGSAEVFRDSITAFASSLWAAGVSAELHVWSGGFHGFDGVVEDAVVSQESHRARREWLRRISDGGV